MNMMLTHEQEEAIEKLVRDGLFASKEEALAYSVRRMSEDAEQLKTLRQELQIGVDQADRGEFSTRSAQDIKDNIRKRLSAND